MERGNLYFPIPGTIVAGVTYNDIQGESLGLDRLPFKDGHIPSIVIVGQDNDLESLTSPLQQVSSLHGRSYEISYASTGSLFWNDEYGIVYSSLTLKGNNLSNPHVIRDPNTSSGFAVFGLQDSLAMVRMIRASRVLRSAGIDTEMPIKIIEPTSFPHAGDQLTLSEFKAGLIQRIWENDLREPEDSKETESAIRREEIPDIAKALSEMTFFITLRGQQVSERVGDIYHCRTNEDFRTLLKNAFKYINKINEGQDINPAKFNRQYNEENPSDIISFLSDYLPSRIGDNYGKLHNLGLIHYFPHPGNISLAGGIYDLDSIRGASLGLGDELRSDDDYINELKRVVGGFMGSGFNPGIIKHLYRSAFIRVASESEIEKGFSTSIVKSYIEARGWTASTLGSLGKINNLLELMVKENTSGPDAISKNVAKELSDHYTDLAIQEIGFSLSLTLDDNHYRDYSNTVVREFNAQLSQYHKAKQQPDYSENDNKYWTDILHGCFPEDILLSAISDDLLRTNSANLAEITKNYSEDITQQIVRRTAELYREKLSSENEKTPPEQECKEAFEYIKEKRWEEDISKHVEDITEQFDYFNDPASYSYHEYYLNLLEGQLNANLHISVDMDKFLTSFLKTAKRKIKNNIRIISGDAPATAKIEAVKQVNAELNGLTYADEVFHSDELNDYVPAHVEYLSYTILNNLPKDQIASIKNKYGVSGYRAIAKFIGEAEYSRLFEKFDDPEVREALIKYKRLLERNLPKILEVERDYLNKISLV